MAATSFAALAVYAGCDRCGNTAAHSAGGSAKSSAVKAAPKIATAEQQKRVAKRFFDHMRAHRFAKAYAMFEKSLKTVSTVAQLSKTWGELEKSIGGVDRVDAVQTRDERGHRVHLYRCHGKRAAGNVLVLIRAAGAQVVGFFVTGEGIEGEK